MAYTTRAHSQAAADAAALAAAANLPATDNVIRNTAYEYANWNLPDSLLTANKTADVVCGKYDSGVFTPDTTTGACNNTNNNAVHVITRKTVGTTFLQLIDVNQWNVATDAVARLGTAKVPCVTVKSKLTINGGAKITSTGCEFDSTTGGYDPAAVVTAKLCSETIDHVNGGGVGYFPRPTTDCTVKDPFAGKLKAPTKQACATTDASGNALQGTYDGTVTLKQGTYCSGINFHGTSKVNLNPGVYYFAEGATSATTATWIFDNGASITGKDVTLYFESGAAIHLNSGTTATLEAPTSGDTSGILMYEDSTYTAGAAPINLESVHNYKGLIYLPNRDVTFNSATNLSSGTEQMTMVVNNLMVNANTDWTFNAYNNLPTASGAKLALVH